MTPTRIGIIGLGSMGLQHAAYLHNGSIPNATLAALCTRNPQKLTAAATQFPNIPTFTSDTALLQSHTCDAVLIVTPHPDHPDQILNAFAHQHHVLVEKPLAVSIAAAQKVIAAYANYPHLKFGIMYNQRTNPLYQHLRQMIAAGELGHISRISWFITNWFRTHAYYASSPWRATWNGEGGGVLINQSIHNLDLLQWIPQLMPNRITAVASLGKTHPIETEDEVSAILEYPNDGKGGAVGHFVTTTGEFPGANRLEIAGSKGQIVAENNTLTITRTSTDIQHFNRTDPRPFGTPDFTTETLPFPPHKNDHQCLTQNFVNAIQNNTPNNQLLAPAPEGLHALELANAILMAGLSRHPIDLPLNPTQYESFLTTLRHPNV